VIDACDAAIRRHADWSLAAELGRTEETSRLAETEFAQPALFAIQVGLCAVLAHFGVRPDAVVGHSIGEVAAAHVAGVLALEEAVRLVVHRGRVMQRAPGTGRMASVELGEEEARAAIVGFEGRLDVAALNSPGSSVLSDEASAVQQVVHRLEARGVHTRLLPVKYAFHSPLMNACPQDLERALVKVSATPALVPFVSTLTGRAARGEDLGLSYWADQIRKPVRFAEAVREVLSEGVRALLEIGPHPALGPSMAVIARAAGKEAVVLASQRRKEGSRQVLLHALAELYVRGRDLDWSVLHAGRYFTDAPTYVWNRQRCWPPPAKEAELATWTSKLPQKHPLLGRRMSLADQEIWESEVDVAHFPWMNDHRIHGSRVMAGMSYIEMAIAAGSEAFECEHVVVSDVEFKSVLVVPDQGHRRVQSVLTLDGAGVGEFRVHSRGEGERRWTLHASARVRALREASEAAPPPVPAPSRTASEELTPERLYSVASVELGPAFRAVTGIRIVGTSFESELEVPQAIAAGIDRWNVHPAQLDAAIQGQALLRVRAGGAAPGATFVPVKLERVAFLARPQGRARVVGRLRSKRLDIGAYVGDFDIFDERGAHCVALRGLRTQMLERVNESAAELDKWSYELRWARSTANSVSAGPASGTWLLCADGGAFVEQLVVELGDLGVECVLVPMRDRPSEEYVGVLRHAKPPVRGVLVLMAPEARLPDQERQTSSFGAMATALGVAQALVKRGTDETRLALVTCGACALGSNATVSPFQAPLWGLGRTIVREHPELHCTMIDIGAVPEASEIRQLAAELVGGSDENQVAFRGSERFVARLSPQTLPRSVEAESRPWDRAREGFRLASNRPGVLSSLALVATARRAPEAGEVEIEVRAAGINFKDVLKALDLHPDRADHLDVLGLECSGVVSRVGANVTTLAVGDAVVAHSYPTPAFASFVNVPARFVVRKPKQLTFSLAATPAVHMTVRYALEHLARLRAGERILVHAASGGIGLAACAYARRVGAKVFATAGGESKRAYLRSIGIEHVFDSRSTEFADRTQELTDGRGIDVVLNSLVGEAMSASLRLLGPCGRFVELGKADFIAKRALGLEPFERGLSFSAVDMVKLKEHSPELFASLLSDVVDDLAQREELRIPTKAVPISKAKEAFEEISRAEHVGKVVLSFEEPDLHVAPAASTRTAVALHSDATYLVTGGLGGLGLLASEWLVDKGARHLVLTGRRDPSAAALATLERLRAIGAEVRVERIDVSDREPLRALVQACAERRTPLRGVIHCAGIVDDAVIVQQSLASYQRVAAAKVLGGWNLHRATEDIPLDFFVLYSSGAAILGNVGQANYAAANAFLDALATARSLEGKPALGINWGPWAEVGMAAAHANRGERLARTGSGSIPPAVGMQILEHLIGLRATNVAVLPIDWTVWSESWPAAAMLPYLKEVVRARSDEQPVPSRRAAIERLPKGEQLEHLEAVLREYVSQALKIPANDLEMTSHLIELGADSLVGIALGHRIAAELEVSIPVVEFLNPANRLSDLVARMSAGFGGPVATDADHLDSKLAAALDVENLVGGA
jgi:acyl transferase domain-containing protein